MKLTSIQGHIIYEGRFASVRRCVEAAIQDNVNLAGVDLRRAQLRHAMLDGGQLRGACLWGANLCHSQISDVDMRGCDMRAAQLKEACMATSDFTGCDFRGAFFTGAIVRGSHFDACEFSCPSIFTVPWEEAVSLTRAVYWHKGETPCALSHVPMVITGLPRRVVMMEHHVLVGTELKRLTTLPSSDLQNRNNA